MTPMDAQRLAAPFNKKYGLDIKLNFHPAGNMVRDAGRVVSLAAAGLPPEWDLMVMSDGIHATLWLRNLHQRFDYRKLGVGSQLIEFDGGVVSFANQYVLPAYNTKVLPAKDVPTSWEDLREPKCRAGKLGVSTATHHFARLATFWGEEKATEYVKALAKQNPVLGTPAEVDTRLQIGEILVFVNQIDSYIHTAKKSGAPLAVAGGIEPVISPAFQAGVPKGAKHPNVSHLFAAFLATPEAQGLWEQFVGQSSPFIPGTTMHKFAQGKKMLYLRADEAKLVDRLAREYAKILGFR